MRERGSGTFVAMTVALLLLLAGSAYVVSLPPVVRDAGGDPVDLRGPDPATIDRIAKASVRRAAETVRAVAHDGGGFGSVSPAALGRLDPSLDYGTESSGSATQVSVAVGPTRVGLAALSDSGTCWWILLDATTSEPAFGTGERCSGDAAIMGARSPSW